MPVRGGGGGTRKAPVFPLAGQPGGALPLGSGAYDPVRRASGGGGGGALVTRGEAGTLEARVGTLGNALGTRGTLGTLGKALGNTLGPGGRDVGSDEGRTADDADGNTDDDVGEDAGATLAAIGGGDESEPAGGGGAGITLLWPLFAA